MHALVRRPNVGYVDTWLWCPKTHIDVESVKKALSLRFVDSYSESKIRFVYLFKETEHHLLVPRHLWQPGTMPFRVVDCRPREYLETGITSRVKLDHRMVNGVLTPTGEDIQQKAMDALLRSQNGILQLRCGAGKGQPLWETVYTPRGPTTIGSVKVGDFILGGNGRKTKVTGIFPQGAVQTYWVHFSDGTKVCCDGNHLWSVYRKGVPLYEPISTEKLLSGGLSDAAGLKFSIPYCRPANFLKKKGVVLDPWLLGAWLGDGSASGNPKFHNPEEDLQKEFIKRLPCDSGYVQTFKNRCAEVRVIGGIMNSWLIRYGLKGTTAETKFIPEDYLYSNVYDRMQLLRGLLDTDGSVAEQNRTIDYCTVSMKLADQVVELVQSLGGRASKTVRITSYTYKGEKLRGKPSARIRITFPGGSVAGPPVSSRKHLALWSSTTGQRERRYIKEITTAKVEETICLRVEARDELYLTSNYTVTHNTVIALDFVARMGGPALVLVDNTNLLEQWELQAKALLDIPGGIGRIQAAVFDWKHGLVLGTYQTMGALIPKLGEDFFRYFKVVIFEEAHHLSAYTFAPSAESFPGIRLALSATPVREDGTNIIYDNHVGPIIYKDVTQVIKPRIVFKWTGLRVAPTSNVYDRNGELHLSKLSVFFGTWLQRMAILLDDVAVAVHMGRKVLVLCNSVDETINLCSLWTQRNWKNPQGTLYTDIPVPTPFEVGAQVTPIGLSVEARTFVEKSLAETEKSLRLQLPPELLQQLESKRSMFTMQLAQDDVHKLVSTELNLRQKKYRKWLTDSLWDAGLMIHKVKPGDRMEYIRTRQVVFGIIKYGKEGLDDESLDTVLVSTPFSSRNGAQQLIGRPSRLKAGKRSPLVVFYEDDIGQLIGMCKKLRHHFAHWPVADNGPLEFEFHGHPHDSHRHRNYPPLFANL